MYRFDYGGNVCEKLATDQRKVSEKNTIGNGSQKRAG